MDDGTAVARWTAQLAVDDCHQCRSGTIGGDARWNAAAITMDGGGMSAMDGSSSDGQQQQHYGWQDSRAIAMGNEMAAVQDNCCQCRNSAMGVWYFRLVFFC